GVDANVAVWQLETADPAGNLAADRHFGVSFVKRAPGGPRVGAEKGTEIEVIIQSDIASRAFLDESVLTFLAALWRNQQVVESVVHALKLLQPNPFGDAIRRQHGVDVGVSLENFVIGQSGDPDDQGLGML